MTTQMSIDRSYTTLQALCVSKDVVVVKESAGWRDYLVEVHTNGQHVEYLDYFTTDKADAMKHADYVARWLDRN